MTAAGSAARRGLAHTMAQHGPAWPPRWAVVVSPLVRREAVWRSVVSSHGAAAVKREVGLLFRAWLAANLNCIPARAAHRQKATLAPLARHGNAARAAHDGHCWSRRRGRAKGSKGSGRCPTRAFLCERRRRRLAPQHHVHLHLHRHLDDCHHGGSQTTARSTRGRSSCVVSRRACLGCPRGCSVRSVPGGRIGKEATTRLQMSPSARARRHQRRDGQLPRRSPSRASPPAVAAYILRQPMPHRAALLPRNALDRRLPGGCVLFPSRQPY
jgi:hypothetical protein